MHPINTVAIAQSQLDRAIPLASYCLTWADAEDLGVRDGLADTLRVDVPADVWDDYLRGWLRGQRLATEF